MGPTVQSSQGPGALGLKLCSCCLEILNNFVCESELWKRSWLVQQSTYQGLGPLTQGCPTSSHFLGRGSWLPDPDPLTHWIQPSLLPAPAQTPLLQGPQMGACTQMYWWPPHPGWQPHCLWKATRQVSLSPTLTQHERHPHVEGAVPLRGTESRSMQPGRGVADDLLSSWTPSGRVEVSGTPRVCSHPTEFPLQKENNVKLQIKNSISGQERATEKKKRKYTLFSTSSYNFFCFIKQPPHFYFALGLLNEVAPPLCYTTKDLKSHWVYLFFHILNSSLIQSHAEWVKSPYHTLVSTFSLTVLFSR